MEIFTTLDRRRVEFVPRDPGAVGIYVCGPTVQAAPHLGHGRAAVVFDVVRRYLAWSGFDVTYVQNVTDIDDKIVAAAAEQGTSIEVVAQRSGDAFSEAYRRLQVLEPSVAPRATEHIGEMIEMIEQLIATGHAYQSNGDVYFSVRSYPRYGKLSRHDLDDLRAGERVRPEDHKRDPLDFALWKAAKSGEPTWESPWGPGRPGWHIECSAMARKHLGDGFDIHAGGHDLIFPHHENEIAQAEAATGTTFARYWLHNGMVNLGGEKMAKSTGHVVDLLDALDRYDPVAVRLFYLRTHYRKPLEFSSPALDDAEASLERIRAFRRRVPGPVHADPDPDVLDRFRAAMDDDFDVAGALGVLFELVRDANRHFDAGADVASSLAAYDEILGVLGLQEPTADAADLGDDVGDVAERFGAAEATIDAILERRAAVREAHDWATSDAIRDALADLGVIVEDTPDGVRWHRG
jgi:cysteinyl-tRNA synthetase